MCRLFVHGKRGAVARSILLLLIPKFLRVFLFRHIVKITVIAHYPTAIAPEGVFVPLSLGVLLPLLTVALINPYAGLIVQVNTHRHLFVLHDERERLTLLHHGQFCRTHFQLILQHLKLAHDDRRRYRHHLIGLRVNLHESLAAPAISILNIGKDSLSSQQVLLLFLSKSLQW